LTPFWQKSEVNVFIYQIGRFQIRADSREQAERIAQVRTYMGPTVADMIRVYKNMADTDLAKPWLSDSIRKRTIN
jgi:hypothetical protein